MTNYEKYLNVFTKMFSVSEDDAVDLEYQGIPDWDSVWRSRNAMRQRMRFI